MDIRVVDNLQTEVIQESDGEKWGQRECRREEHYIAGIVKVKSKGYLDLSVSFDVEPKQSYYLIYVLYDAGDSFGWDENLIQYVDLFECRHKAEELKELIKENNRITKEKDENGEVNPNEYTLRYKNEAGQQIEFSKSWQGYFERFQGCYVEEVELITSA